MLDVKLFFKSLQHAVRGLKIIFLEEQNIRIQFMIGACAFAVGLLLGFTPIEFGILVLLICVVITAELFNSVCERILDAIKPRLSLYVGQLKDILAGSVLIVSLAAVCIASLLYIPKIIDRIVFYLR